MDTPAAADDGDPAKATLRFGIFILSLSLIIVSCSQKKPAAEIKPPAKEDTTAIRQQKQLEELMARSAAKPKKKIYLTFDDGPNRGTRNVLNTVKEEKVPVSFFVVGQHAFDSPQQEATWNALKTDSTIEVCNHSFTHASNRYTRFYQHPAVVVKDFERTEHSLDLTNNVVRMPGRNAWRIGLVNHTDIKESRAAIDSVHSAGFAVMGWDVEWTFDHETFAVSPNTDHLLRQIANMLEAETTKTPGHLVILAHDQAFQKTEDVEHLKYFLQQLKNNPDYELVFASTYPGVKNDRPRSSVTSNPISKR